jgi:hypothetical protein
VTEILTAEVIQALLGLATVVATGAFAWYRAKYTEAAEQGDLIMSSARKVWELIKAVYGSNEKASLYLTQGEAIMSSLEAGWADSRTKTPEMEEYYQQLLAVATEIGNALA